MASNPVRAIITRLVRAVAGERGVQWIRRLAVFITGQPVEPESGPSEEGGHDEPPRERP